MKSQVGILTGTTASGKTALAIQLAAQYGNIEIINADSMLVYRGLDIGTAKPSSEELAQIKHHLVNLRDPDQTFAAGDFVRGAQAVIKDIEERGKRALIVGGTGFYLKALLYGLWAAPQGNPELRARLKEATSDELFKKLERQDPHSALRIGKNDRYRLIRALELIETSGQTPTELEQRRNKEANPIFSLWVVDRENVDLHSRTSIRTEAMLKGGFVEEVKKLCEKYPQSRALSAVGYAQVHAYLKGKAPPGRKIAPGLTGLAEEIQLANRQLVKRQRTWFRGQKTAKWFILERDRDLLLREFEGVYRGGD